jgi:hypothetical protein
MIQGFDSVVLSQGEIELNVARALHASHLGDVGHTCMMCRLDTRVMLAGLLELGLLISTNEGSAEGCGSASGSEIGL